MIQSAHQTRRMTVNYNVVARMEIKYTFIFRMSECSFARRRQHLRVYNKTFGIHNVQHTAETRETAEQKTPNVMRAASCDVFRTSHTCAHFRHVACKTNIIFLGPRIRESVCFHLACHRTELLHLSLGLRTARVRALNCAKRHCLAENRTNSPAAKFMAAAGLIHYSVQHCTR